MGEAGCSLTDQSMQACLPPFVLLDGNRPKHPSAGFFLSGARGCDVHDLFWFTVLGVAVVLSVVGIAGTDWIPERVRVKGLENRLRNPYDQEKDNDPRA